MPRSISNATGDMLSMNMVEYISSKRNSLKNEIRGSQRAQTIAPWSKNAPNEPHHRCPHIEKTEMPKDSPFLVGPGGT